VYVPVTGAECGIESFSPTAFASHAIGSESLNLSDELRDTLSRLLPSSYKIMYFFCSVTERLRASKAVNRNTNFSGWKRVTEQCFYLKSSFNSKEITRSGFLWCRPTTVTQQAMSQRFLSFPATLFEGVFKNLLPSLRTTWYQRNQRPLPESIQFALTKFSRIWIVDSSTLEALFCKLKSLEDIPKGQLAGKMATVIDLMTRLPVDIWFLENPRA
jgi:hypothetical protein